MTSLELTLKIARAISDVSAAEWDACANPGAAVAADAACSAAGTAVSTSTVEYNPFISHDFLECLELSKSVQPRVGWQPMHLARAGAGRPPDRCRAVLCQVAFARRIRVRPRLGRGIRARRRTILPQAAGLGAVHAGDRPTAAGPRRACGRRGARGARRCPGRRLPALRGVLGARHLPDRTGMAVARRRAASSSARTSSSTGTTPATAASTTSSPRSPRASARPSAASARTRWRTASRCTG